MTDEEIQNHVDEIDAIRDAAKQSFLESFASWDLTKQEKKALLEYPAMIEHIEMKLSERPAVNDFRPVFMLKFVAVLLLNRDSIAKAFMKGALFR